MKKAASKTGGARSGRRQWGRAQSVAAHDSYKSAKKPKEPLACGTCGAVYRAGRWLWAPAPKGAAVGICQACHRIADRRPAGLIVIEGAFLRGHGGELVALARNQEALEKQEHPLNRIMEVKERKDAIEISTTDIHLPRRIGRALKRAFHGTLAIAYDEGAYFARATWRRDD